jgi:hypothetical protein
MGFLVKTFQGLDYAIYTDMYVSIESFSITHVNNQWKCQFYLQANKSREEKYNGFPKIFLSYWVQTGEFEIVDVTKIMAEIYGKAKPLFGGDENCTDVFEIPIENEENAASTA